MKVITESAKVGLQVNIRKAPEVMTPEELQDFMVDSEKTESVAGFLFLGSSTLSHQRIAARRNQETETGKDSHERS